LKKLLRNQGDAIHDFPPATNKIIAITLAFAVTFGVD
jgi:hypothetical protein